MTGRKEDIRSKPWLSCCGYRPMNWRWHNVQNAAIIKHRQWTMMTMSQIDSTFWNAKVKRRLLSGYYSRTVRPTKSQHLCCHGIKSSGKCLRVHSACYDNDKLVHMVVVEIESMLGTLHRYHPCGSVQTWKGKPLQNRKAVRCSIFSRMKWSQQTWLRSPLALTRLSVCITNARLNVGGGTSWRNLYGWKINVARELVPLVLYDMTTQLNNQILGK